MTLNLACQQMTSEVRITKFCQCQLLKLSDYGFTVDDIIDAASDAVVVATNGQVRGRCTTTVRPCADTSCACGWPGDGCSCCRLDAIHLPGEDIEILSVKIDGDELTDGMFGWLDQDGLIRLGADSPRTWPGCQKMYLPDTEEGTFSITYEWGLLPFTAVMASTEIACDLVSGITSQYSKLDRRVITAIMDGVTIDLDPNLLGLFEWTKRLVTQYPGGPQPLVWSPEVDDGWSLHSIRPA
jgi:hypothetical protein